jgi:hypothetical protein
VINNSFFSEQKERKAQPPSFMKHEALATTAFKNSLPLKIDARTNTITPLHLTAPNNKYQRTVRTYT